MDGENNKTPQKFFLFFDAKGGKKYSKDDLPYRGASSEVEARRLSENWDGHDGLWFECELDENDDPINLKARPDIPLKRKANSGIDIYTFLEGDLITGQGSILGIYDTSNIQRALVDLRGYFGCVHYELEGKFISDDELAALIIKSSKSLIITTNNGNTFFVHKRALNNSSFDQIY